MGQNISQQSHKSDSMSPPGATKKQMKSILSQDKEMVKWLAWEMGTNCFKVLKLSAVPSTHRWNLEFKEDNKKRRLPITVEKNKYLKKGLLL